MGLHHEELGAVALMRLFTPQFVRRADLRRSSQSLLACDHEDHQRRHVCILQGRWMGIRHRWRRSKPSPIQRSALGAYDLPLRIQKTQNRQMGLFSTRARRMRSLARVQSQAQTVCHRLRRLDIELIVTIVDEGDDSDESGSFGDEESEGEDWDELERKAKRGQPINPVSAHHAIVQLTRREWRTGMTLMKGDGKRREAVDEPWDCILKWAIQACHSYSPATLSCRFVQIINVVRWGIIKTVSSLAMSNILVSLQSSR